MTPLFVFGAPRSGTTFFTTALNTHPQIFITNELRAWNSVVDLARRLDKPSEMLPAHPLREAYKDHMLESLVGGMRTFYRDQVNKTNLGCPFPGHQHYYRRIAVFGDKNPGYADANNKRCLEIMSQSMADAKFIHVHRDPRSCVASYLRIGVYPDDLDRAIDIWLRHAETSRDFTDAETPRCLTVRYEDFAGEAGHTIIEEIIAFLHIDASKEPGAFLDREREKRTPFRSPATETARLGETTFRDALTPAQIARVEDRCGAMMERLGYS